MPAMRGALVELASATVITPARERRAVIHLDVEARPLSADPVPPVAETTGDLFKDAAR